MASFLSNLTYVVADSVSAQAMGMAVDYIEGRLANGGRDRPAKFYYQYEAGGKIVNVLVRGAVFSAASYLSNVAVEQYKNLLKLNKEKEWKERVSTLARNSLIKQHNANDSTKYGRVRVNKGSGKTLGNTVYALDYMGNICVDALMLSIPVRPSITINQNVINATSAQISTGIANQTFQSDMLVWYDTTAMVSVNSDKNLILTRVQGRDYSRKELVSNGDIEFTVTGKICSNMPDVYPEEEVQKFKQIVKYKGVVEVNNQIFDQFDISRIVIRNFNLTSDEGQKSQQNYTFTAVGIQPEKERVVTEDTVHIINQELAKSLVQEDGWDSILKEKINGLKATSADLVSQGLALAVGVLDGKMSKL